MFSYNLFNKYSFNIAFISQKGSFTTYADLLEFSKEISDIIKIRSLFFIVCNNSVCSLKAYVSCMINRHVPLLLDSLLSDFFLLEWVEAYEPNFIWLPKYHKLYSKIGILILETEEYGLHEFRCNKALNINDDLALLLTTSGSIGKSKVVRLSYNNILKNSESIAHYLNINCQDKPVTTLPLNYSFGLSIVNSHLIKGASILVTSKSIVEKEFWSFVRNQNATSIAGVPYTFEILKKLNFFKFDLPSLKIILQAGGKLNEELFSFFATNCMDKGIKFYAMYGQTEASPRISYLSPEYSRIKIGSIGKVIPGGELYLSDEENNIIDRPNTQGELVYTGDNVFLGYSYSSSDLSKGDEINRVLYTGDLAYYDEDGFFFIIGRKSRFIKIYGVRIGLDEIENELKKFIPECACIGIDNLITIFLTDESFKDLVIHYLSLNYLMFKKSWEIKIINSIPKNESGKILYNRLVEFL